MPRIITQVPMSGNHHQQQQSRDDRRHDRRRRVQSSSPVATRRTRLPRNSGNSGGGGVATGSRATNGHHVDTSTERGHDPSHGAASPRSVGSGGHQHQNQHQHQHLYTHGHSAHSNTPTPPPHASYLRGAVTSPRAVTPSSSFGGGSAASWDDVDDGVSGAGSNVTPRSQYDKGPLRPSQSDRSLLSDQSPALTSIAPSTSAVTDYSDVDEDMPMDEMADTLKTMQSKQDEIGALRLESSSLKKEVQRLQQMLAIQSQQQQRHVRTTRGSPSTEKMLEEGSGGGGGNGKVSPSSNQTISAKVPIGPECEVAAEYTVPPNSSNLEVIISALAKNNATRPANLSIKEIELWDSIQQNLSSIRTDHSQKRRQVEQKLQEAMAKIEKGAKREQDLSSKLKKAVTQRSKTPPPDARVSELQARITSLTEELESAKSTLKEKQSEHEQEVRAIQRVLADVATDREEDTEIQEENERLKEQISELQEQLESLKEVAAAAPPPLPPSPPPAPVVDNSETIASLEAEVAALKAKQQVEEDEKASIKREMDKKMRRILVLERELKAARTQVSKSDQAVKAANQSKDSEKQELNRLEHDLTVAQVENNNLQKRIKELQTEMEAKDTENSELRQMLKAATLEIETLTAAAKEKDGENKAAADAESKSQDVKDLETKLAETVSSLESAKAIITSLENANSSISKDMKAKIKAREDDMVSVQNESAERKRKLDCLAMELRDLQKKQGDAEKLEKQNKIQISRLKTLVEKLGVSMSGLQSAVVVHEASSTTGTTDSSNLEEMSEILSDILSAVRTTVNSAEDFLADADDVSLAGSVSSETSRHVAEVKSRNDRESPSRDLRFDLDQKKNAVRRLEQALQKQNEELKRVQKENEVKEKKAEENQRKLRAEISSLREQCSTNIEIMAKKERELAVLRSTLNVDDDDGGYISDDASDCDDEAPMMPQTPISSYGGNQSNALATLLSHGGTALEDPGRVKEMETLKTELQKLQSDRDKATRDLQAERESLANAKMIISSLEKANKSMMEDLRSRLQDSNTTVASLLDKTLENERTTSDLRDELERVRKERDEIRKKYRSGSSRHGGPVASEDSSVEEKKMESESQAKS